MHLITIHDGPDDFQGTLVNSPYINGEKCKYKIHQVLQGVSDMEFTLTPNNAAWGGIKPLRTLIKATDSKTGEVVFSGRVLKPKQSMAQNGAFSISYVCENKMAYFNDSVQRYGVYQNMAVASFLETMLSSHNSQVEPYKQFKLGNVTVTDPNGSIYRYLGYENTLNSIQDKLIDRLGGFLSIREEPDGTYLDYLESVGEVRNTPISLRVNLKSLQREIDPTEVITRLIVLGAKTSDEANNNERLTMASVNGGKDYLDKPALIAEFGIIEGTLVYDDINTPSTLLLRANQFFDTQAASRNSYNISAVDLSKIDDRYSAFNVGDWYQVEAGPLAISEPLQIIGKTMTHDNPQIDSLEIGEKQKTLSSYQHDLNKKLQTFDMLQMQVDNQSATIGELNAQLFNMSAQVTELGAALQYDDETGVALALQNLQNSIDDFNVPLVTTVNDGLMLSSDKVKLDSLQTYETATTMTDGLMSSTDKVSLDKLVTETGDATLLTTTDKTTLVTAINELVSRIETLEGTP